MNRQEYRDWYTVAMDTKEYYAQISAAQGRDPQATARTRDTDVSVPPSVREKLFNISAEIKNYFHEFGAPLPPLMEGCTVVDLCCGSGRDTYLAAQLVGAQGRVIGIDPDPDRLKIAEKYLDQEIGQFGYESPNVEFVCGVPEGLSMIPDASVDIVLSNCTFNLSPDKEAYVREVARVLKDDGEWYFTDVFTDRRIPTEKAKDTQLRAMRLGGAMFINDFRRLAQANGMSDPRYPFTFKTPLSSSEQALFPDIAFATITVRVLKSAWTEDVCESYGETVTYKGTLPDYPDAFIFDFNIAFPTGKTCPVCGNVSGLAAHTRYNSAFEYTGSRRQHVGDTHGDPIIKTAPDYEGVYDEDDQPVNASCC
jgi:arsenite methyltransferase